MNSLLITIPTYKRYTKLTRLLNSLKQSTYQNFDILVVADGNDTTSLTTAMTVCEGWKRVHSQLQLEQSHVVMAINDGIDFFVNLGHYTHFLMLCDDTEVYPSTLEIALKDHNEQFPDMDGVIGLHQECPNHPEYTFKYYGQMILGRKWIERYKEVGYKVACPQYIWGYQDEELHKYAVSLDKFYSCKDGIIRHYHPSFIREEMDDTHNIVRFKQDSPKPKDDKVFAERQKRGLIWGKTWEVV